MDFITELPTLEESSQLWVVIDRFTKMAHFLPLREDGKTATDLAVIFAREVWKYHGLPTDIVSDRDSRFISEVWKEFLQLSGIWSRMSIAFHPQTDGQTERLNQTIEAYLQAFVGKEQDDWVHLLPMAEFPYNNSITAGNGMSPFYANYGFHPAAANPPCNRTPQPCQYGVRPLDAGCPRSLPERTRGGPGTNAMVHRPKPEATPRIPSGKPGHAQQTQH